MKNENLDSVIEECLKSPDLPDDDFFSILANNIKEQDSKRKYDAIREIGGVILRGIRGTTIMEAGYVYAPYIPLQGMPDSYQSINAEAELTTLLSEQLDKESISVYGFYSFLKEQWGDEFENSEKPKIKGFTFYDKYVPKPKHKLESPSRFVSPGISVFEIDHSVIQYAEDYSESYSERSFIDKSYVDTHQTEEVFHPTRGIMSRYATKINSSLYGVVGVNNLTNGD